MEISIITICNKKDNNVEDLITKNISHIKNSIKLAEKYKNQTKKIQKNLYEKEYRKALSIINQALY